MSYNKELNYCTGCPEAFLGIRHNYACYLHDRQYRNEVKARKTRKEADQALRDKIYQIYSDNDKKMLGYILSRLIYVATRLFGSSAWK